MGVWGDLCQNKCPENCLSSVCKYDGGCSACKEHHFGHYCQFNCSSSCFDRNCSMMDGHCYRCPKGLDGNVCRYNSTTNKCKESFYGKDCEHECKDKDGSCLSCLTDESGQYGGCTECLSGNYPFSSPGLNGSICTHCPEQCVNDTCDAKNGFCINGCRTNNKYGNHCKQDCSKTCKNESCDWKKGHCLYGCIENSFGKNCEHECEPACHGAIGRPKCNETDGHCFLGCLDGYHGKRCESKCSDKCLNLTCSKTSGACLDGCIKGYEGPQCLQRMNQQQQEGHTTGELLGAAFGAGLIGIMCGVLFMVAFIMWRRRYKIRKEQRGNESHELTENETEKTSAHVYDSSYENEMPLTYEALKGRDESNYSQLASSQ